MPPETFRGPSVSTVLATAHQRLGPDALVLDMRRVPHGYQLIACQAGDPTAGVLHVPGLSLHGAATTSFRPPLDPATTSPHVVALVGPTGSGKTTSIAKIATHPQVFGQSTVGLIGLDTFRIGAAEQLQTYADLAGLPCAIIHQEEDITRSLRRMRDCRVILVDTPGRGPEGRDDLSVIRTWLERLRPAEVHLSIPAGLLPRLARAYATTYRPLGPTHVLATKIDECPEDSGPFTLAVSTGLAMRWQTNGQDVPRHLAPALSGYVAAGHRVWRGAGQDAVA